MPSKTMPLPQDYAERVYAGVLGKIIGVYLGRPFEGWSYERIMRELGEIRSYVHDRLGVPLVVTDDDISGTFTFLRALPDHANSPDLTAEQIGRTWLNYLIENKTILWWGGLGNSSEHTAYLRLKHGIPAPLSGALATNGPVVAEQIGAQIFIDGWAMVYPGEPEKAADLARRAASVSHDREAIYGAQVLAAMEAQAFVETDIDRLIDTGLSVIPADALIRRLVDDVRGWVAQDGDWRKTFGRIQEKYGYQAFPGNCHIVPNHALIHLGLLYGQGDFNQSMMIVNTCGWDTDCNSGNLGCLLGIRNGLKGFAGPVDWRGPVADRIYLSTMDGGRCITDAAIETYQIVNAARGMRGLPGDEPKQGARFHFELPGSVQGFQADSVLPGGAQATAENALGHSRSGHRSLAVQFANLQSGAARVCTPTFIQPQDSHMPGYELIASPALYPGQTVTAGLSAAEAHTGPFKVQLYVNYYDAADQAACLSGPAVTLAPGAASTLTWKLPEMRGLPIFAVGLEISAADGSLSSGTVYLDSLTWDGVADTVFTRPDGCAVRQNTSNRWDTAWVCAVNQWEKGGPNPFRLLQNEGRGLLTTGLREWRDYAVSATLRTALIKSGGLAARVQGLQRYYTLQLTERKTVQLVRVFEGQETVLAEAACDWQFWEWYTLKLEVQGDTLRGWVDGNQVIEVTDHGTPLTSGAIGLAVEEGFLMADAVRIEPR